MRTHEAIITDAGGYRGLAAAIGLPESRVRFWALRKSIPAEVWLAVSHAKIASLEELAAAAKARAESETHTRTKIGGVKEPDAAQVDRASHAAKPSRVARRASRKNEAAA